MRTPTSVCTYFAFGQCLSFFLSLASKLVILLLELGGRVGSLEQDLETTKATIGRSTEALPKSLEERCALKGELDQIHNVA